MVIRRHKREQIHSPLSWTRALTLAIGSASLASAEVTFEAPSSQYTPEGIAYAGDGVVLQARDLPEENGFRACTIIAEGMRYDTEAQSIVVTGRVQMLIPQAEWELRQSLIITCSDLRYDIPTGTGIALDATFNWTVGHRQYRITCTELRLLPDRFIAANARFHGPHGSVLEISSSEIVLGLLSEDEPPGHHGRLEDLTIWRPTVIMAGMPFLWLPVIYRDLTRDYPWTRYELGYGRRLGAWISAWTGTSLPRIAGWSSNILARYSSYEYASHGHGIESEWHHQRWGDGRFDWFRMPHEEVRDPDGERVLQERQVDVINAAHRAAFGTFAVAARYATIPDASALEEGPTPGERFRSDFLADQLNYEPFARRGVTASWASPAVALVADSEYQPNDELAATDRVFGMQAATSSINLFGPLHFSARGWFERLDLLRDPLNNSQDEADRVTASARLSTTNWWRGIAMDHSLTLDALGYQNVRIDDPARSEAEGYRWAPTYEGGLQVRLQRAYAEEEVLHTVTPRLGVEIIGDAHGEDELPDLDFQDGRDVLEEDRRYLRADLDTTITGPERWFHLGVESRWALRAEERTWIDDSGTVHVAESDLVRIKGSVAGAPHRAWQLSADANYDGLRDQVERFDLTTRWRAAARLQLRNTSTWIENTDTWEYRTGFTAIGNRYRLDVDLTTIPGGIFNDRTDVEISRQSVDGVFSLGYRLTYDDDGHQVEEQVVFTYTWHDALFLD